MAQPPLAQPPLPVPSGIYGGTPGTLRALAARRLQRAAHTAATITTIEGKTSGTTTSTTIAVTLPSTVQAGDLIVVAVAAQGSSSNPTITKPSSSWTQQGGQSNKGDNTLAWFSYTAISGDAGATYNFSMSGGGADFAIWWALDIRYSAGFGNNQGQTGDSNTTTWSAFSFPGAQVYTLMLLAVQASVTVTWPTGFIAITAAGETNGVLANSTISLGVAYYTGAAPSPSTVDWSTSTNFLAREGAV